MTVYRQIVLSSFVAANIPLNAQGTKAQPARAEPHGKWEPVGIPVQEILAHPEPLSGLLDLQELIFGRLSLPAALFTWGYHLRPEQGLQALNLTKDGGDDFRGYLRHHTWIVYEVSEAGKMRTLTSIRNLVFVMRIHSHLLGGPRLRAQFESVRALNGPQI
jgi:hypothetical protein